jgi:hypothetical protein
MRFWHLWAGYALVALGVAWWIHHDDDANFVALRALPAGRAIAAGDVVPQYGWMRVLGPHRPHDPSGRYAAATIGAAVVVDESNTTARWGATPAPGTIFVRIAAASAPDAGALGTGAHVDVCRASDTCVRDAQLVSPACRADDAGCTIVLQAAMAQEGAATAMLTALAANPKQPVQVFLSSGAQSPPASRSAGGNAKR